MGVEIFILDYSLSYSIVDTLSEHCHIRIKKGRLTRNFSLLKKDRIADSRTQSRAIFFPPFFFFRLSITDRFGKMGVDYLPKIRNKIKRQELYRNSKIEKSESTITQRKERAQAEKIDPKLKEAQPLKICSIQR
jgi:hypothetical protein